MTNKELRVVLFDLDETLGYFQQFGLFCNSIEAMKKKKLTELELTIKHHIAPAINHQVHKTISYSQYSIWANCPHQWYNSYVKNLNPYSDTIHTIFGTAMHETLQHYISVMYLPILYVVLVLSLYSSYNF